jgi:hypothetical protein
MISNIFKNTIINPNRSRRNLRPGITGYFPVYLVWKNDPRNSIVVHYHQSKDTPNKTVYFRLKNSQNNWGSKTPDVFDFQNENLTIHHAELTNLQADSDYEFKIGSSDQNTDSYFFRTMPNDLSNGVRGAFGGDFQTGPSMWQEITKVVGLNDCRFFAVLGDWVNDDGVLEFSGRWVSFWENMADKFKDTSGRLIPIVPAMGNHEAFRSVEPFPNMGRLFFEDLFAFPDEGQNNYGVIDIGDYMSIFILDTTSMSVYLHSNPHWAANVPSVATQKTWFENALNQRQNVKYKIVGHHVPFFPSHRAHLNQANDFDLGDWLRIMHENDVRMIFCGHDHTFNISKEVVFDQGVNIHPAPYQNFREITGNEKGIREFGDGGLGTKFYPGNLQNQWYVDKSGLNFSHVSIVEFNNSEAVVKSMRLNPGQNASQYVLINTETVVL